MLNIIKYLGIFGVFLCLIIMYTTNHGLHGIQRYDVDFKLLDMQFHYNAATVHETFQKIGAVGHKA